MRNLGDLVSMASCHQLLLKDLLVTSFVVLAIITSHANGSYKSIFSFGDSNADTGNTLRLVIRPNTPPPYFARLPYGETFFHHPTGRFSDGRLVIDFIAGCVGLPSVQPYSGLSNNTAGLSSKIYGGGANFAIAGATALDASFFANRGIPSPFPISSLRDQLKWFKELLPSLCSASSDCNELVRNSLVVMGEIGGNDYSYPFLQGRNIKEIQGFVPRVVHAIGSGIKDIIKQGAVTILVPGTLPIGCSPSYLTQYNSSNKEEYDHSTRCIGKLNNLSMHHNELLQIELKEIQKLHPHAKIIYADYYKATIRLYRHPQRFGGPYNYNQTVNCGDPTATTCADPSLYISWDGNHYTEAAYKQIFKGILQGPFTIPHFNIPCMS
ncbi:Lipase_GDSL domain-containing protein [Cephalotus follicularis]|uniref:Lipase_GDSL domain-containing protein n=1 Tax=Cephalotus follicularis TaxID=3775 RepID=A0A1Q3ATQ0_CEPFO|nr:Lipase_GDSL domain-containing protein [Cephalotus follicularis]